MTSSLRWTLHPDSIDVPVHLDMGIHRPAHGAASCVIQVLTHMVHACRRGPRGSHLSNGVRSQQSLDGCNGPKSKSKTVNRETTGRDGDGHKETMPRPHTLSCSEIHFRRPCRTLRCRDSSGSALNISCSTAARALPDQRKSV